MLFEEYKNFEHIFPEPQYLGAKVKHLAWIKRFVPIDTKSVIDAFSGSQSVAFFFKQMGLKTISNDFLNFNNQIGKALIENKSVKLTSSDVKALFQPAPNKQSFCLFEKLYTDVFFEKNEAVFLDNFRANVEHFECAFKKAIALSVMNRSMTRKITMGHFAHTQALNYARDPERIKRNRSLVRPLEKIFEDILPSYNNAVFDNGRENRSLNENILDLLPGSENIDLAYFDPPYCNSHADYQGFYHLLETYTEYWEKKEFINGIKRYEPQRYSGFDKKADAIKSFEKLFEISDKIPNWLISYNDRSYPEIGEFEEIISKYRDVRIESKTYHNSRGGKGSVAGSQEILFVCTPKKAATTSQTRLSYQSK
jgi:adenine-specific DNA-methyltransferase